MGHSKANPEVQRINRIYPLWGNRKLEEIQKMGAVRQWERSGLNVIVQLYQDGSLKSFQELKDQYAIPNKSFYRYLQIRHASTEKFRGRILE